uniref:Transcription initiation factor TFIID subunit 6 n=1 Tax=Parastrongyloides trichosuri TaxID=131310 RepID=A0A0N4ZE31_PARTI
MTSEEESNKKEYDAHFVKSLIHSSRRMDISLPAAKIIAEHLNNSIRMVLEQAAKFQRHSRRKRMLGEDFENALIYLGHQPQTGFSLKQSLPYSTTQSFAEGIPITKFSEVDVNKLVHHPKAMMRPLAMELYSHWLVVDGVQPLIPENPSPEINASEPEKKRGTIRREGSISNSPYLLGTATKELLKTEQVQIKTATTHAISLEQQVFFNEIMRIIISSNENQRLEAITTLKDDRGLQPLIPRFICAMVDGILTNVVSQNMALVIYLLRGIRALVQNPVVDLEECLQAILPAVISSIVSKKMGKSTEDHWKLREFAAQILKDIVKSYSQNRELLPRVTRALCNFWNLRDMTTTTLYATLYTLHKLEFPCFENIISFRLQSIAKMIQPTPSELDISKATQVAAPSLKMQEMVMIVCDDYIRRKNIDFKSFDDYKKVFGTLAGPVQQYRTTRKRVQ